MLSSGRAFIAAESEWSKAQKDAVFYLTRYATERSEGDFEAFQRAMRVQPRRGTSLGGSGSCGVASPQM